MSGCSIATSGRTAGGFSAFLDHRVQDFVSGLSLAVAGYAIAIVPESMANIRQPSLFFKPIADFDFPIHLAVASRQRELSPAVRAFVGEPLAWSRRSQS